MSKCLVQIVPKKANKGKFYFIELSVPDTDDKSQIEEYVSKWIDNHLSNVRRFELLYNKKSAFNDVVIKFKTDMNGNDFIIYIPEIAIKISV